MKTSTTHHDYDIDIDIDLDFDFDDDDDDHNSESSYMTMNSTATTTSIMSTMSMTMTTNMNMNMTSCSVTSTSSSSDSDSNNSNSNTNTNTNTKIRFSPWKDVHEIPSLEDLSDQESSAIWYVSDDYETFQDECETMAKKMEEPASTANKTKKSSTTKSKSTKTFKTSKFQQKDKINKQRKSEILGLDNWTKFGFRKRQRRRQGAIDIVLDEQFAQWKDGSDDLETIAELYMARSADSKMVALTKGMVLERQVQRYYYHS